MERMFFRIAISRLHFLFRALLLASLALYIMHLNETDLLHYYLAPHMQTLLLLCRVPLLFIAFGMVYHAVMGDAGDVCDCEHPHPRGIVKNVAVYGLFALPLLFGLLVPDQPLASSMAAKKGMVYTYPNPDVRTGTDSEGSADRTDGLSERTKGVSDRSEEAAEGFRNSASLNGDGGQEDPFKPKDKYGVEFSELARRLHAMPAIPVNPSIFSETVGALDLYKQAFLGKRISVEGFVFRDGSMDGDMFAVSRFLLMCCTADAVPFGILAAGKHAAAFETDAWVAVEGTIGTAMVEGTPRLLIHAQSIERIEPPASPYIFTNPDSVAAFDELYPRGTILNGGE